MIESELSYAGERYVLLFQNYGFSELGISNAVVAHRQGTIMSVRYEALKVQSLLSATVPSGDLQMGTESFSYESHQLGDLQ